MPLAPGNGWRRCWLALAEAEQELGLPITDEQLDEMRAHIGDIDFAQARIIEQETRHAVMANIRAYGMAAPKAKPIIHLGATSCFVGDNTDLILLREGVEILLLKAVNVLSGRRPARVYDRQAKINMLKDFADGMKLGTLSSQRIKDALQNMAWVGREVFAVVTISEYQGRFFNRVDSMASV